VEEKRRIVEETLQPGASVARVARAHEVNANQVFAWRRQYRRGRLGTTSEALELLPVRVIEAARETARSRSAATGRTAPGTIQVELPKGHLRLTGYVDAEALRMVLEKLLG
jgi:transposase